MQNEKTKWVQDMCSFWNIITNIVRSQLIINVWLRRESRFHVY